MNEDEAKKKWCPMVRAAVSMETGFGSPSGFNAGLTAHGLSKAGSCIGSACMMWRYSRNSSMNIGALEIPSSDGTDGFCGIAGKP